MSRTAAFKRMKPDLHDRLLILLAQCGAFMVEAETYNPDMFEFVSVSSSLVTESPEISQVVYEMVQYYKKNMTRTTRNTKYNHIIAMITFKLAKKNLNEKKKKDTEAMLKRINCVCNKSKVFSGHRRPS